VIAEIKQMRTTGKQSRLRRMIGDGMVGSVSKISRETWTGPETEFMQRAAEESCRDRSQSVRSSDEAGNDRGAKGRRKEESEWNI
jgi:hypothetical protein